MNTSRISAHQGALILIDMLYEQGYINRKTYENIQNKYNKNKKGIESEASIVYNANNKTGVTKGELSCQQE